MKQKLFLIVIFALALIGVILFLKSPRREGGGSKESRISKPKAVRAEPAFKRVKKRGKKKLRTLEEISVEELKGGVKKRKEEFELTPSADDLIKMKKEKITVY